jgi:acyl-CoA thioester hydrolase
VAAVLRIEPRWTDLDPVGHVNDSVFLGYAEGGRARFLHTALPDTWSSIVFVHKAIDYTHPGQRRQELDTHLCQGAHGSGRVTR